MKMLSGVNFREPWEQIEDLKTYISDPGTHDAKPLVMSYDFLIMDASPPLRLRALLDRYGAEQPWKARWRVELYTFLGFPMATAVRIQDYPQTVVYVDAWDYTIPTPPYTDTGPPSLGFAPANYAEGGSPYG